MKTAVYGGTFNPIHRGHIHILGEFMERLALDRALLIPDGAPPHKQARDLAPGEHRLGMCRLAAEALPGRVEASPMSWSGPAEAIPLTPWPS